MFKNETPPTLLISQKVLFQINSLLSHHYESCRDMNKCSSIKYREILSFYGSHTLLLLMQLKFVKLVLKNVKDETRHLNKLIPK